WTSWSPSTTRRPTSKSPLPGCASPTPYGSNTRSSGEDLTFLKETVRNTSRGAADDLTPQLTTPSPSMVHYRGGRAAGDPQADLSTTYAAQTRAVAELGCTYLQLDDTSLACLNDPTQRGMVDERSGDFAPLRFVPEDKYVVLGLVTTEKGAPESKDDLKRRIDEAARHIPRSSCSCHPSADSPRPSRATTSPTKNRPPSSAWSSKPQRE